MMMMREKKARERAERVTMHRERTDSTYSLLFFFLNYLNLLNQKKMKMTYRTMHYQASEMLHYTWI